MPVSETIVVAGPHEFTDRPTGPVSSTGQRRRTPRARPGGSPKGELPQGNVYLAEPEQGHGQLRMRGSKQVPRNSTSTFPSEAAAPHPAARGLIGQTRRRSGWSRVSR